MQPSKRLKAAAVAVKPTTEAKTPGFVTRVISSAGAMQTILSFLGAPDLLHASMTAKTIAERITKNLWIQLYARLLGRMDSVALAEAWCLTWLQKRVAKWEFRRQTDTAETLLVPLRKQHAAQQAQQHKSKKTRGTGPMNIPTTIVQACLMCDCLQRVNQLLPYQNFWLQQHVAALFKDENYGHNQGLSWTETSKKTFQQLARRIQYDPKIVFNVSTVPDEATWFASGVSYVLFGAGGACKRFLSLCTSFVEDYWEGEMRLFARNAAPGSDMTCMAIVGTDESCEDTTVVDLSVIAQLQKELGPEFEQLTPSQFVSFLVEVAAPFNLNLAIDNEFINGQFRRRLCPAGTTNIPCTTENWPVYMQEAEMAWQEDRWFSPPTPDDIRDAW